MFTSGIRFSRVGVVKQLQDLAKTHRVIWSVFIKVCFIYLFSFLSL